jgi:hypothetical protein
MEVSGQLYPQGKSPWYSLDRKLSGPQSWSGCGGEEKIPNSNTQSSSLGILLYQKLVQKQTYVHWYFDHFSWYNLTLFFPQTYIF